MEPMLKLQLLIELKVLNSIVELQVTNDAKKSCFLGCDRPKKPQHMCRDIKEMQ